MKPSSESNEFLSQDRESERLAHFSWPLIPLIGIVVVIGFGVFVLVYELKQVTLTRHVVHEDVARQSLSGKVAIDVLQCRRYEKDVFLNLHDSEKFVSYLKKWRTAWNKLSIDTDFLSRQIANEEETRLQILLNNSVEQYHTHFMSVVAQIQAGKIDTPAQANLAMTPFKDGMRQLITSSTRLGCRKCAPCHKKWKRACLEWRGQRRGCVYYDCCPGSDSSGVVPEIQFAIDDSQ